MVEVDVFWSYGIGASFAMAAWRQLRRLKADRNGEKWLKVMHVDSIEGIPV